LESEFAIVRATLKSYPQITQISQIEKSNPRHTVAFLSAKSAKSADAFYFAT